ncbi:MAG: HNH endonuclease [Armatimonas sp.]
MNSLYPEVSRRAGRRCEYCHAPESVFNFRFEVEHILPSADGGSDDLPNLCLACRACNSFKGAFTHGIDSESGETVSLFHPRRDGWEEHFVFNAATFEIHGLTPVGRATVERLRFNDIFQLEARPRWMALNLFPDHQE